VRKLTLRFYCAFLQTLRDAVSGKISRKKSVQTVATDGYFYSEFTASLYTEVTTTNHGKKQYKRPKFILYLMSAKSFSRQLLQLVKSRVKVLYRLYIFVIIYISP
jgi:hypothetical protein